MRPTDRTVKKEGMLISAQSIGAVLFNNHEMLISAQSIGAEDQS